MSSVGIGADKEAKYFVIVPASAIETGTAATHGPLDVWEATQLAAQARLDYTLATLRSENLDADGALGDYRPLRALASAVDLFHPDQIVIATLPPDSSVWHRFDVVDRARAQHGLPVTHVVAAPAEAAQIGTYSDPRRRRSRQQPYSGMFLCRPRRGGASASAWVSALRVWAGSILSSTTPISIAESTPPAIRSCSAASSSCSASRS